MSQIMSHVVSKHLLQDYHFDSVRFALKSTATSADCFVCGKGLQDGVSITAKNVRSETILFCDEHY